MSQLQLMVSAGLVHWFCHLLFIFRNKFHNIIYTTTEHLADLTKGFNGDVFALTHFGDGIVTDIRRFRKASKVFCS